MISLSVSTLKPALAGLSKVIANKTSLECLRCIRVDATEERVTFTGTDLDLYASVELPDAKSDSSASFLLPMDRLQSMVRRLPSHSLLYLEEGNIACDLGTGRVSEDIESPKISDFSESPAFSATPTVLPEAFAYRFAEAMQCSSSDTSRYILNGVHLDVSGPADAGHYLVATDGKHLFSANSFSLPIRESVTIPHFKMLSWRGLTDLPWALAAEKQKDQHMVRIVAGDWTLTMRTIEGNYPNWRQVVPHTRNHRTLVTLPEEHQFAKLVNALPGTDIKDKPVCLVVENQSVFVRGNDDDEPIALEGASAEGPNLSIRVNREYLTKAFACGLTNIGLVDSRSPLHFTREGRQMVVMPLRAVEAPPTPPQETPPAQTEPQQQSTPMPETTVSTRGHTNGATPHINGAPRSAATTDKPALEAAIDKLDAFKTTIRETLVGVTELSSLLRQAVRDQKSGEKEIHQVRQTLRSLQSVRI